MDRIPFANYDFFAHLSSGLVVVVGMERVFGFPEILGRDMTLVQGALLLLTVYVAGQLVATPAKALLEDLLIGRILGRPAESLLQKRRGLCSILFSGYFRPLPPAIQKRVLERAASEGVTEAGEPLFLHIRFHRSIRADDRLMSKLNDFLSQYGFSRNLAFASLVVGASLLVKWRMSGDSEAARYGIVVSLASILLLYPLPEVLSSIHVRAIQRLWRRE